METERPTMVFLTQPKNVPIAVTLSLLLGPFGMFYATPLGA